MFLTCIRHNNVLDFSSSRRQRCALVCVRVGVHLSASSRLLFRSFCFFAFYLACASSSATISSFSSLYPHAFFCLLQPRSRLSPGGGFLSCVPVRSVFSVSVLSARNCCRRHLFRSLLHAQAESLAERSVCSALDYVVALVVRLQESWRLKVLLQWKHTV